MGPDEIARIVIMAPVLLASIFALKLMVFGKGPIRRAIGTEIEDLATRVAELEERNELLVAESQGVDESRIAELEERLDFAERLLTSGRSPHFEEVGDLVKEPTPS